MCDIGSFSPSTATPRALRPSIVVIYVNVSTRTPRQWMPTLNGLFALFARIFTGSSLVFVFVGLVLFVWLWFCLLSKPVERLLPKRKLVQKEPLMVLMIAAMENFVRNYSFLICTFMRGRFPVNLVDFTADSFEQNGRPGGFVQARVTRTKSAYTLERKTCICQ